MTGRHQHLDERDDALERLFDGDPTDDGPHLTLGKLAGWSLVGLGLWAVIGVVGWLLWTKVPPLLADVAAAVVTR